MKLTGNEIEDLRLPTEDAMLCEEIFYKDQLDKAKEKE